MRSTPWAIPSALDLDQDGWMTPQDCNDQNPEQNPCSLEVPWNGIDDDCALGDATVIWIPEDALDDLQNRDWDGDGFPVRQDCDDYNSAIHPGAAEVPGDGRDNNCNSLIDEAPGYNWQIVRFTATRVGYEKEDIQDQIERLTAQGVTDPQSYEPTRIARVQGSVTVRFDTGSAAGEENQVSGPLGSIVRIVQGTGAVRRQFGFPASLLQAGGEQTFNYDITYAELGFPSVSAGNAVTITMSAVVDHNNVFPGETSETDNVRSETLIPGPSPITLRRLLTVYSVLFSLENGGYTHGGAQDEWEYAVRAPGFLPYPHEKALYCWATDMDGYYENNSDQWLDSPPVPIPADLLWANAHVDYWASFASGDKGFVEVWQDGTKILEAELEEEVGVEGFALPASSFGHNIKFRFRVKSDGTLKSKGLYLIGVKINGEAEREI